jgi:hypothetical protein
VAYGTGYLGDGRVALGAPVFDVMRLFVAPSCLPMVFIHLCCHNVLMYIQPAACVIAHCTQHHCGVGHYERGKALAATGGADGPHLPFSMLTNGCRMAADRNTCGDVLILVSVSVTGAHIFLVADRTMPTQSV